MHVPQMPELQAVAIFTPARLATWGFREKETEVRVVANEDKEHVSLRCCACLCLLPSCPSLSLSLLTVIVPSFPATPSV